MEDRVNILDSMQRTPSILSAFIETIPIEKLDVRRGKGFWTVAEHVSHLAQVQPMLLERFRRFVLEEQPRFTPFIPGEGEAEPATPHRLNMAVAIEQFTSCRNNQLTLLAGAAESVWQRTGMHPEYEQYSLHILARHVLLHDYWHMYRMEELWLTRDSFLTRLD